MLSDQLGRWSALPQQSTSCVDDTTVPGRRRGAVTRVHETGEMRVHGSTACVRHHVYHQLTTRSQERSLADEPSEQNRSAVDCALRGEGSIATENGPRCASTCFCYVPFCLFTELHGNRGCPATTGKNSCTCSSAVQTKHHLADRAL